MTHSIRLEPNPYCVRASTRSRLIAPKLYITLEFAQVPGIAVYDVKAGRVTKKIDTVIAGNYAWVHPKTDKLYFPTRSDRVVVIDTKADRVVAVIPTLPGSRPNGVAFGGPNGE